MRYVIRKIPERDTSYLERHIPNAEIYCDSEHVGPLEAFIRALEMGHGDAVYMQDDILICKHFTERVEAECLKRPNDVIMFSEITRYVSKAVKESGYCSPSEKFWLYCTYIPERVRELTVKLYRGGGLKPTKTEIAHSCDDNWFGRVMKYIGVEPYMVVPNLAGHTMGKSYANSRHENLWRVSLTFDYEDAEPNGDMTETIEYVKGKWSRARSRRAL